MEFDAALTYLQQSPTAVDLLTRFAIMPSYPVPLKIVFNTKSYDGSFDFYNPLKGDPLTTPGAKVYNAVYWDPFVTVEYVNTPQVGAGYYQTIGDVSSALVFSHEGFHALDGALDNNAGINDPQYDNVAEKNDITTFEALVAQELGETIRQNHTGIYVALNDENSTEHTTLGLNGYEWQEQSLNGQVTVTGGSYSSSLISLSSTNGTITTAYSISTPSLLIRLL